MSSESLDAYKYLPGTLTACSWQAGWRSVLLRAYEDAASVEPFTTAPTVDHLIVLVTRGSCALEIRRGSEWLSARHLPGHVSMTPPGEQATLRWRGTTAHSTLQLHLPAAVLERVRDDVAELVPAARRLPSVHSSPEPMVEQAMLSLARAMRAGVPELYAETTSHMLAAHLILARASNPELPARRAEDQRLRRVDAYLREHLADPVTLEAIAREAGLSRFHLLRSFKQAYGETPFQRLTRLRMDKARQLLMLGDESITEVAAACGYTNPAHFASAFRRATGVTPRAYRQRAL